MPSPLPTFAPTPYPSPGCEGEAVLFSAQFLSEGTPDGSRWSDVVSTVYSGFFTKFNPRTDDNVLLTQLSDPYPDRDFLCIVDGCYTLESASVTNFERLWVRKQ